jgi:hypothetical protein
MSLPHTPPISVDQRAIPPWTSKPTPVLKDHFLCFDGGSLHIKECRLRTNIFPNTWIFVVDGDLIENYPDPENSFILAPLHMQNRAPRQHQVLTFVADDTTFLNATFKSEVFSSEITRRESVPEIAEYTLPAKEEHENEMSEHDNLVLFCRRMCPEADVHCEEVEVVHDPDGEVGLEAPIYGPGMTREMSRTRMRIDLMKIDKPP